MEKVKLSRSFADWYEEEREIPLRKLTGNVGEDVRSLMFSMVLKCENGKTLLPKLKKQYAYDTGYGLYGIIRFGFVHVNESLVDKHFIILDENGIYSEIALEKDDMISDYGIEIGKMLNDLVYQMVQYYADNNIIYNEDYRCLN